MVSDEIWLPIPGLEGRYEVSNHARVRSLSKWKRNGLIKQSEKVGYMTVKLYPGATEDNRTYLVHRLVLMAFVGPCPDGMEALHKNGVSTDNFLSNLRWGTHKDNMHDMQRHGAHRKAMDKRMSLTKEQVEFVRKNYRKIRQVDMARKLGAHRATIQRVHSGERYGN